MEETRPILYGVADYVEIRKANAWFIDRVPPVALHRLVLVFHGGECVLGEEV